MGVIDENAELSLDRDGFETARLIRSRERTRHTPIIFLTAHELPQSRVVEAYQLGAVDYLMKPLDRRRLGAACELSAKLVGSRRRIGRRRERRMKGDRGIREGVTKAGDLEMLSGVLSWCICRCDDEAETMVVPVIAEEDTPFGALRADCLKTRPDQLAANTPPLKSGLDRHRSEDKPPVLPRGTRLRERDMADDLLTKCGDER